MLANDSEKLSHFYGETTAPSGASAFVPSTDGGRAVTLKDVAAACGVHVMTVSRALRHDRSNLAEETIARICAVAQAMGYNPERQHSARRLVAMRKGDWVRTKVLALFYPPLFAADPYANRLLQGIMDVLVPQDYTLLLVPMYDPAKVVSYRTTLPSSFSRGEVDGVLALADPYMFSALLTQMRQEPSFGQRPVVSLMAPVEGCAAVHIDDQHGAYLAAKHLLALGHRHLLHAFPREARDIYFGPTRYAGYCQAYREMGLNPETYLHPFTIITGQPQDLTERVREPLLAAIATYPATTAILAPNDYTARVICHVLTNAGIRIPDDMSLIGFDDTYALTGLDGRPFLSTVANPLETVGREAATLLLRLLDGSAEDVPNRMVVPVTDIIPRLSTAAPRPD